MNHKGTKTIETKRLLLRKFSMKDAKEMYRNWAGNEMDTQYTYWDRHQSKSDTEKILRKWVNKKDKNKQYVWCVEKKDSGEAVGEIIVEKLYKDIEAGELSFCFSQECVDQSMASEAVSVVIKFLFKEVQMQRIQISIDADAEYETNVLLASDFMLEGTHPKFLSTTRGIVDGHSFGITRYDFIDKEEAMTF